MTTRLDVHETLAGAPLRDAGQDVAATVTALLAVVRDMPNRLDTEDAGYAAAVASFLAGLQLIADDEVGPPDAEAFIGLAVGELGVDPDAAASLTLVDLLVATLTAGEEVDFAGGLATVAGTLLAEEVAAAFLVLVQNITDVLPGAEDVDFAAGLRAIADVLDPP